ncbi:hypothetical protein [Brevibacillus borstelensis]|uniref:hypothetical protein n=1 Tax=Brevibacillus borstelensis TaxID=45462 RepID=UPI0030C2B56D
MDDKDFAEIEEATVKRFMDSMSKNDVPLAPSFAKIASRVAAIAIQEYHQKLQEKESEDR